MRIEDNNRGNIAATNTPVVAVIADFPLFRISN
jgi:hypothetical protein